MACPMRSSGGGLSRRRICPCSAWCGTWPRWSGPGSGGGRHTGDAPARYCSKDNRDGDFNDVDTADVIEAFDAWHDECQRAREIVAAAPTLDMETRGKRGNLTGPFTLRWIMVHMIEEYARHNGHADLLRERIDGSTGA